MIEVHFTAGTHIAEAAKQLVAAATERGNAFGHFNDVQLNATASSTEQGIVEDFHAESVRRQAEYEKSPAGIKAKADAEQRRRDLQATHDRLMAQLPTLDLRDQAAVLDWLCAMQEPTDRIGVIVRKDTIVGAFKKAGFEPNVNTGKDYKPGDRDNMFRYLVGQALAGLSEGPAIHGILHKFADEWRAAFLKPSYN